MEQDGFQVHRVASEVSVLLLTMLVRYGCLILQAGRHLSVRQRVQLGHWQQGMLQGHQRYPVHTRWSIRKAAVAQRHQHGRLALEGQGNYLPHTRRSHHGLYGRLLEAVVEGCLYSLDHSII